jgi:MFS family permease
MGLLPDGLSAAEDKARTEQGYTDERIVNREWASTEWTLRKVFKKYQFWALFSMQLGTGFAFSALINHLVAFMTDIGFDALFAAQLLLFYAVSTMVARACGFLSDMIGREIACTIGMTLVLCSLVILLTTEDTSTPLLLYIAAICLGLGSGIYVPTYAAATADLFQGKGFGSIVGFTYGAYGLSASINTWLYGYIFDVTGSYTLAIMITIFAACMMILAMWVAAPRKVKQITGRTSGKGNPSA